MSRYPVAWMGSVLTFLQVATGGLAALDLIPEKWVAALVLFTAALTAAWAKYTHDQVTPISDPKSKDGTPLVPAE